jgi:hypothetical protein
MEAMNLIARVRARGWGLLLVPLALQYALLTQRETAVAEVAALDLAPSDDDNRRVLAVVAYLES